MPSSLERRRSNSATPPTDGAPQSKGKRTERRRTFSQELPGSESPGVRMFRSIFRRGSDSATTSNPQAAVSTETTERGKSSREPHGGATAKQQQPPNHHRHDPRKDKPSKKQEPSAKAEPQQPYTIQDALEYRLATDLKPHKAISQTDGDTDATILLPDDLKALFSGAPHFLLEKGVKGRWFPQVIFPWDEHDTLIQQLWDRRPFPHASYTQVTLHAHLPVPHERAMKGDGRFHFTDWTGTGPTRATFNLGVFEVPNMLSMNGREPGTIGFRHFLELPVSDSIQYTPEKPRLSPEFQRLTKMPATEAYDLMQRYNNPYSQCKDGTVHDRQRLLRAGPSAWKRIGVRDINFRDLVHRLECLRKFRNEVLLTGKANTLLNHQNTHELYDVLFSKFLYSPPRNTETGDRDPHGLKSQITVLTEVLSTPGAWLDFSLVEWRFRVGQVLWEAPPHLDGDCLEISENDNNDQKSWITHGLERKWFLIQMLLAAELLLRLDTVVRFGILQDSHGLSTSPEEVHRFDKLRRGKVNWDFIAVRRFFDNLNVQYIPVHPKSPGGDRPSPSAQESPSEKRHRFFFGSPHPMSPPDNGSSPPPQERQGERRRRFSAFGNFVHRLSEITASDPGSAWNCTLLPARAEQQLEGLFVFAENIGWPQIQAFKELMISKIHTPDPESTFKVIYGLPVRNVAPGGRAVKLDRGHMYCKGLSSGRVVLHPPSGQESNLGVSQIGGWISRSWLSGFVLPGESLTHLLMGTILENDPKAIATLGPLASFYGGFIYGGRSWWSHACIVGRVLPCLDGVKACMGWMSIPVLPCDATTAEILPDTWLEVLAENVMINSNKPRIKHGSKLAMQSTPLGEGKLSGEVFSLPIDAPPSAAASKVKVTFQSLALSFNENGQSDAKYIRVANKASVSFMLTTPEEPTASPTSISFPLRYNVQFISSQECRLPFGYASYHCSPFPMRPASKHQHAPPRALRRGHAHLPGHPLHTSYAYRWIPLDHLAKTPAPPRLSSSESRSHDGFREVLVVDARGCQDKETFARAWCASVGVDAIISRVGRTCLACCIREARALEVAVVVRVGD